MLTTDTLTELNDLRSRVLRGEHVPDEELHAALKLLRDSRATASEAPTKQKQKKATMVVAPGSGMAALRALKDKS